MAGGGAEAPEEAPVSLDVVLVGIGCLAAFSGRSFLFSIAFGPPAEDR